MAANFEQSPGALAGVPGACVPHVLRLLGTDVPLELAIPVTFTPASSGAAPNFLGRSLNPRLC